MDEPRGEDTSEAVSDNSKESEKISKGGVLILISLYVIITQFALIFWSAVAERTPVSILVILLMSLPVAALMFTWIRSKYRSQI